MGILLVGILNSVVFCLSATLKFSTIISAASDFFFFFYLCLYERQKCVYFFIQILAV